jgi:anti-sigma factor RsiW
MCNDPELILGYVYGELPEAERRGFDAHLTTCAACRGEVAELRAARGHLAAWTPPEPDFGFQIVRGNSAPAARRWWPAPAWGLAAAAVLVLAVAAAIANVEVRYDSNGLVVRTGWARDAAASQGASAAVGGVTQVATTPEPWRAELAAVTTRLRELEEAAASREAAGGTLLASGPRMSDAEVLRRVREMVGQSETRQQREFAMQITQVVRDMDRAVQLNNARIWQGLGKHREQTSAEAAQAVNYILRSALQSK